MKVNDNTRIERLDKYCLVMEIKEQNQNPKTGKIVESWKRKGYYGSLEQALQGVLKYKLFNSVDEVEDIQGLLWYIQQCNDEILKAVKDNK